MCLMLNISNIYENIAWNVQYDTNAKVMLVFIVSKITVSVVHIAQLRYIMA